MFESAHTKSRPQKKSTLLRAHFCHVNKTACLVALKFKSTEKEHTFKTTSLVALISKSTFCHVSKTASLVALISKSTF